MAARHPSKRAHDRSTAIALAAIAVAAYALAQGLATIVLVNLPTLPGVPPSSAVPAQVLLDGLFLVVTPIVGALVAVRRPENPTGWLFLAIVTFLGLGFFTDELTRRVAPTLALGYFATVSSAAGNLAFAALFMLFATFPTGRLPGRAWRLFAVLTVVATGLQLFGSLLQAGPVQTPPVPGLEQPLAQPAWAPVVNAAQAAGYLMLAIAFVAIVPLLVARFRRASGVEREQLKWFVSAASLFGAIVVVAVAAQLVDPAVSDLAWIAAICTLPVLPIAAAIAILRHRLFDIDLIINRTLVYAGLSGVLVGVYAASVLLLQQLLSPLTRTNSLAVAGSTLLVAALFQPVRRRVQSIVDARFYRQRYSARREIERFGAGLRDEVDIERVEGLLTTTVERTVQPAFASIWLRESRQTAVFVVRSQPPEAGVGVPDEPSLARPA